MSLFLTLINVAVERNVDSGFKMLMEPIKYWLGANLTIHKKVRMITLFSRAGIVMRERNVRLK